jgi:hypothetical protein
MDIANSTGKRKVARYLDAVLFIAALLLVSSLLEIIRF